MPSVSTTSPSDTRPSVPSVARRPGRFLLIATVLAGATLAGCQSTGDATGGYSPSAERELNKVAGQR